jgi:pyruvate/2-oxoglutarate dehydrogenase complex dihydrolipoamide acyltransferase (E2) component
MGDETMKKNHHDYKLVPYPKMRRVLSVMLRVAQRKHMMHGLVEMDVTKPHQYMREHKARTGESLSFTAFIVTCLGRAVDENKYVQAYRKGRDQLVLFDDVDVSIQVERKVDKQKNLAPSTLSTVSSQQHGPGNVDGQQNSRVDTLFPHIVRAANKKTFREIHQEIRAAQEEKVETALSFKVAKWAASLPTFMIVFLWRLAWRMIMRYPRLQKKYGGTVGVTAVGMFGKGSGWGIPTAAHSLDITLGGIGEKAVAVDGRTEFHEYLSMTISMDHDIIDGAPATRFALRLKELIESGFDLIDQDMVSGQIATHT